MTVRDFEFIAKVLQLFFKYDFIGSLHWDGDLNFYILCNDVFYPAADAEPITPDDLLKLEQSFIDDEYTGDYLFCARKRKMRPQQGYYKHIDKDKWDLFDKCGKPN